MKNYFLENGIIFQTYCTGIPQQNGRVKRKHQHILDVARALRFQGCLPFEFWRECVLTTGYLINRTLSSILNRKLLIECFLVVILHMIIYEFLDHYVMLIHMGG